MYHRELAADLVRGDGHVSPDLLRVADDVEVGACWLDKDDICSFLDIPRYCPSGKASPAGGQLIAFSVAERGGGSRRIPERAVQAAGKLGAVGHENDLVRDARLDQFQLDGFDASVVHVRRGDAVCARFRVGDGDVADAVYGEGVVEAAVVAQDAAVAVGGVFAETDVGDDEQGWESGAEDTDCLDDWAFGVVGSGAKGIFHVGSCGDAEKDDGGKAFANKGLEVRNDFVDPAAMLIRE